MATLQFGVSSKAYFRRQNIMVVELIGYRGDFVDSSFEMFEHRGY